ncbi:MAG: helix-turn-helix transcriptional regulator [Bacteroidales bacterium]|jgi:transcriptional regulator with XRE-family HTH domain|nr:helix-turn-helix transcriptional regulator [Bacteroidales bacterium]
MNKRLQQFLSAENISQTQFADSIGVAKASVSHILAGRNKPGFDFLEGISKRYPNLSLEWLISGRGRMYKSPENAIFQPIPQPEEEIPLPQEGIIPQKESQAIDCPEDKPSISKILVFYSDGTFREIQ